MSTERGTDSPAQKSADHAAIQAGLAESRTAAQEVTKDAVHLTQQARVLCERSAQARAQAQNLRSGCPPGPPPLITVSMACRRFGVCERTLRRVLEEPDIQARLLHQNHRVGIFYRYTLLLPPDLVDDLAARFAAKRPQKP